MSQIQLQLMLKLKNFNINCNFSVVKSQDAEARDRNEEITKMRVYIAFVENKKTLNSGTFSD